VALAFPDRLQGISLRLQAASDYSMTTMMAQTEQTVFLVDASSFIYRSYHAVKGLSRSDGFPTNAIHGFLNIIRSVLNQYQPTHFVLAYDLPGPTFRHEQFEHYKATPEDALPTLVLHWH